MVMESGKLLDDFIGIHESLLEITLGFSDSKGNKQWF